MFLIILLFYFYISVAIIKFGGELEHSLMFYLTTSGYLCSTRIIMVLKLVCGVSVLLNSKEL